METYLVELINNKASKLLQDLEDLKIIKVLKKSSTKKSGNEISPSAKFRGALQLTDEQYNNFQKHAKDIRNEWPENI